MRKNAFTLIEILIVIVIFGVGILAILSIMASSVKNFDTINMQTRATLLTKEGLDLAFHHRDTNLEQGYPRNYSAQEKESFLGEDGNTTFKIGLSTDTKSTHYFLLEKADENGPYTAKDFDKYFDTFALELANAPLTSYTYKKTTTPAPNKGYARRVEFSKIADLNSDLKLLKVSSHVIYKRGTFTGEVVLESIIGPRDSESN